MGWKPAAATILLFSLWSLPTQAQVRGGAGGHAVAVHVAPPATHSASVPHMVVDSPRGVRSRRTTGTTPTSLATTPLNGNGFLGGGTVQDLFGFPAPGLGFDYTHLAAVNGNLGVMALIDPVTQQEIALALRIRGSGFGAFPGFFAPYGGTPIVVESPSTASEPEVQAAPQQQPIIVVTPPAAAQATAQAADQSLVPLYDPGEFVLVRRDGRLLFAVAFTSADGRVVYVTKDGLRRTVPLDQLDVDSTQRMNEERGTSVQLPAA
jgi:hypothetical protein